MLHKFSFTIKINGKVNDANGIVEQPSFEMKETVGFSKIKDIGCTPSAITADALQIIAEAFIDYKREQANSN